MVGLQLPVKEVAKCLLLTGFNLKESHVVRVCPCCIELNHELQPAFHTVLCHHAITFLDRCRRTELLHMQVLSRPSIHLNVSLVRSTMFFKLLCVTSAINGQNMHSDLDVQLVQKILRLYRTGQLQHRREPGMRAGQLGRQVKSLS